MSIRTNVFLKEIKTASDGACLVFEQEVKGPEQQTNKPIIEDHCFIYHSKLPLLMNSFSICGTTHRRLFRLGTGEPEVFFYLYLNSFRRWAGNYPAQRDHQLVLGHKCKKKKKSTVFQYFLFGQKCRHFASMAGIKNIGEERENE